MENSYESRRAIRDELRAACRALRADLKGELEWQMQFPDLKAKYWDRWQALDRALQEFSSRELNFDSRAGLGLAERIVRAVPLQHSQVNADIFRLLADVELGATFAPADLAQFLTDSYGREGWGEAAALDHDVYSDFVEGVEPDYICSELNNFFCGLVKIIRREEVDRALAMERQDETSREQPDALLASRLNERDSMAKNVFAWRSCCYCFRMVPERSRNGRSITGKTCSLHDPAANPARYRAAKRRFDALVKHKEEAVGANLMRSAVATDVTPLKLQRLMAIALNGLTWSLDDQIFKLVRSIFSFDRTTAVDVGLLGRLRALVLHEFPPIAKPTSFCEALDQAMQGGKCTPPQLHRLFSGFLVDEALALHPDIIAISVALFREEAWFAQRSDKNYYKLASQGDQAKL